MPLHRLTSALLIIAGVIAAVPAAAVQDEIAIDHWGNNLLVTAPAGVGDARLANSMSEKITVEFVETPILEVVDFLRKVSSCNFVCDPTVAASNAVITLKADKMELRNVLTWVTKMSGLHSGYVNEAIYLSEKPIVGETRTTLYDVSDLVMPIKDFPGPELAFNQGSGGTGVQLINEPREDVSTTTIEELEELVRKHARH
ncbi:MAG: hypothetical protein H0V44_10390 [Planctomycetes bacterium]|nr:hypothetical protein [Planctomycetota bacterium]